MESGSGKNRPASKGAELTVIVPVYNAARWIPDLLATLRAQSMKDFEVIFIDDGSTDSGTDMLRRAAAEDSRIRVLTQPNRGQAAARNAALDEVRTPWVTFIDIDDLLHPDAFAIWMEEARRLGPGAVVKSGWIESEEKPEKFDAPITSVSSRLLGKEEALEAYLYQSLPLTPLWGGVYDSSIFGPAGEGAIRLVEGMYYEDLEIGPRILDRAEKISFIPAPLYFYRQHPGSFIHTFSPKRFDALKAVDMISRFIADRHPGLNAAAADRRWSANFNIFLLLAKNGKGDKALAALQRQCWKEIKKGRKKEIRNGKIRKKNRLAALLSYLGPHPLALLARHSPRIQ